MRRTSYLCICMITQYIVMGFYFQDQLVQNRIEYYCSPRSISTSIGMVYGANCVIFIVTKANHLIMKKILFLLVLGMSFTFCTKTPMVALNT